MVPYFIVIISLTLIVIEILVGIGANGFIVLVNYIDWWKSRKLSPADLILTCLGLSRLVWQTSVILDKTMYFFSLGVQNLNYLYLIVHIMWIFTTTTNAWFATWLSVFYLAKIANFSHPIFLLVKQRISGLVPWLLLGSAVLSTVTTITLFTSMSDDFPICNFYSTFPNINDSEVQISDSCKYIDIVATVPNSIPFLIFLSPSVLLITSLWRHTRHLQQNGIGIQDLTAQAHLTAIKTLASFSVMYLSSFLALITHAILIWNNMHNTWPAMLMSHVMVAYPSGHALILMLINPKLKQTWVRMLHHIKCC